MVRAAQGVSWLVSAGLIATTLSTAIVSLVRVPRPLALLCCAVPDVFLAGKRPTRAAGRGERQLVPCHGPPRGEGWLDQPRTYAGDSCNLRCGSASGSVLWACAR